MLTTRRRFLQSTAGVVAGAISARGAVAAPPIVGAEITPQAFGATGGDAARDTLGWNRAVEEASRAGRPILGKGTYVLRAPAASRWNWWKRPTASTHVAVQLRSHTHILGKDCKILVGRPEMSPGDKDERHFLFGTDGNVAPGTLTDIQFEGLTFDFREEFGTVHPFTYAMGIIGVDDFQRRNVTLMSSGTLAGRGLLSENIRRRTDIGIRHTNIVQGIYTRYETGVAMRQISFDKFVEALDFDGPCWDVVLDDLQFRNGLREAQCIDTGGGDRWSISNVKAEDAGSIVTIYIKANAWPTYAQWLDSKGATTPNYVIPSNMTVRNVWGRDVGLTKKGNHRSDEAARIGTYRDEHWYKRQHGGPSPKNITFEDWTLEDSSAIFVNDCENLVLKRVLITNPRTSNDRETGAGLVLRESNLAFGGRVTGTVSDVTVKNSRGMGVNAVAGRGLSLDGITVDGYNLDQSNLTNAGIRLRARPGTADTPQLGRTTIRGGTGNNIDGSPR